MKRELLVVCLGSISLWPGSGSAGPLAFPDAVGHGRFTVGGRGGAVHLVTTLADFGPGSLRACVEASGPRTCIFRVSGVIATKSPMVIRNPYITIAGQSSPGGIVIRIDPSATNGRTPLYAADTSQIIVRHLRLRPTFDPNNPVYKRSSNNGIGFERSDDWIVDHVSTAYTADQSMHCFQGAKRWTVSNSLFGRALSIQSHHYGPLLCGDQHRDVVGEGTYARNASSLMVRRNPNLKTTGCTNGALDVVNNVVYSPGQHGITIWDDHPGPDGFGTCANIVGNVGKKGPLTTKTAALVTVGDLSGSAVRNRYHLADNLTLGGLRLTGDNSSTAVLPAADAPQPQPVGGGLSVAPIPASQTFDLVLSRAGAWPRDSLDQTIVGEIRNGTGAKPPQSSVGLPFPVPSGPAAPADLDRDGMPDTWELAKGLNPADPADRNGTDARGYTWLEVWLDERHRALVP